MKKEIKPWFENKADKYRTREEIKPTKEIPPTKPQPKESFFKRIKKAFTPKDVEEVRPGFFIQARRKNLNTIEYRQVKPLVWKGKWKLKGQIRWMNIIIIIILIGLYVEGSKYVRFYDEVISDPKAFCQNVSIIDRGSFGVINENTNSIQFDIGETPTARGS